MCQILLNFIKFYSKIFYKIGSKIQTHLLRYPVNVALGTACITKTSIEVVKGVVATKNDKIMLDKIIGG